MNEIPSVAVAAPSLTVRLLLSRIQAKAGDMSSISAEPTCRDVRYPAAIGSASNFVGFDAGIPPLDSAKPDVF
jgi:hypothetical protein